MKKDFTYISLLDEAATQAILEIQKGLDDVFGHSDYADQWPPHTTISFGNQLDENEIKAVEEACEEIAKSTTSFHVNFEEAAIVAREIQGEKFFSLRLKISKNEELEKLTEKVISLAKKFEVPFDVFTGNGYHVTLGRYSIPNLDQEKLSEIITLDRLPKPLINSFSLFYSMQNIPKPEKSVLVKTFYFS